MSTKLFEFLMHTTLYMYFVFASKKVSKYCNEIHAHKQKFITGSNINY